MLRNRDVPGVVGAVGTLLGRANVNIAGLALGRDRSGGMAINLVAVDGPVPAAVLRRSQNAPRNHSASADRALMAEMRRRTPYISRARVAPCG